MITLALIQEGLGRFASIEPIALEALHSTKWVECLPGSIDGDRVSSDC